MKRNWYLIAMLIASFTCGVLGAAVAAPDAQQLFEARVYQDAQGKTLPYRLMKPANYDPRHRYPLVLFLHGAGSRGSDNTAQIRINVVQFATDENRAKYPCFVVAPQCPAEAKWVDCDWSAPSHTLPAQPNEPLRLALEIVDALQREFPIDAKRLYITGVSMGGFGVWDVIARYPNKFAAAAPVCGGADEHTAPRLARLPIWAFHGGADTTVLTSRSRNMIAALQAVGGHPRYTEYPGIGHDSWTRTYADPELYSWMFAQKRK